MLRIPGRLALILLTMLCGPTWAAERSSIFSEKMSHPADPGAAKSPAQTVQAPPAADIEAARKQLNEVQPPPPASADAKALRDHFDNLEKHLVTAENARATRYAVLDEQRLTAQRAGWVAETRACCDRLAKYFYDVDPVELYAATVPALAESVRTPEETATLLGSIYELLEQEASFNSNFDSKALEQVLKAAEPLPRKLKDAAAQARHLKQLEIAKGRYQAWVEMRAFPIESTSPKKHASMGRFLCLYDDRWDEGLSFLPLVEDAALRSVAKLEEKGATDLKSMLNLGNAWWDLAAKPASSQVAAAMRRRAAFWYEISLPEVNAGQKAQLQQRIDEAWTQLKERSKTGTQSVVLVLDGTGTMVGLKFDLVKKEVLRFLKESPASLRFGVVIFYQDQQQTQSLQLILPRMEPNKMEHQGNAMMFLDSFTPSGSTNPLPALEQAFRWDPQRIVFLSDGEFDNLVSYDTVVRKIAQLNKGRGIKVDTIMFGDRDAKAQKVMETIARENGGQSSAVSTDTLLK